MQPNKKKIALAIGALLVGASGASNAATGTFDITVNTIADVVLTEETPLDFGTNIFTSTGSCTMDAATPSTASLQIDPAVTATATNYGDLNGSGCVTGAVATPGVYKVTGSPGATINITINGFTSVAGDYSFTPNSNAVGIYGATGASGAAGDDIIGTLSTVGPTAVRLPDATEALEAEVTANELVFTLGGTLTVTSPLTANTTYGTAFDAGDVFAINVVY
ncbi:hypothetical protein [Thalassotalea ganghwensis]